MTAHVVCGAETSASPSTIPASVTTEPIRSVTSIRSLVLTDKAREFLAERGFDPAYGARPLKRLIQKEIQDQLALRLLQGEFADGDRIEADAGGGGLVFTKL